MYSVCLNHFDFSLTDEEKRLKIYEEKIYNAKRKKDIAEATTQWQAQCSWVSSEATKVTGELKARSIFSLSFRLQYIYGVLSEDNTESKGYEGIEDGS